MAQSNSVNIVNHKAQCDNASVLIESRQWRILCPAVHRASSFELALSPFSSTDDQMSEDTQGWILNMVLGHFIVFLNLSYQHKESIFGG